MRQRQIARRPRRIPPVRFTLADRVVARPTALRADETVCRLTLGLRYAAQWAQATGGAR